jgi:predicted RNA methylase
MASSETRELGQFIPLHYHFQMLSDTFRMSGFRNAIDQCVTPESTVLELGSGTGVLSFFAAEKARKVYSVELNLDLVEESRRLLELNHNGERVEVIHADALEYLPPEPVDVVICEMLHAGLLREKQLEIIDAFKNRYQRHFDGHPLPLFIPMAVIQAIQPVQHDFKYESFYAPIIQFQHPYGIDPRTIELGEPVIYHQLIYGQPYGLSCQWSGEIQTKTAGTINAVRIITRNILAIEPETEAMIEWDNQYLVQPLEREIPVLAEQRLTISLDYPSGAPLSSLRPVVSDPLEIHNFSATKAMYSSRLEIPEAG